MKREESQDNYIEDLEQLNDKLFRKYGFQMDIEASLNNVAAALACEQQRQASPFPRIPVVSAVEFADNEVLNMKLDSFNSDWFVFLRMQEEEFDEDVYPSSFFGKEKDVVAMLREDYESALSGCEDVFLSWLSAADEGDKIRVRRKLRGKVTGKVGVKDKGIVETTDYVLVLQKVKESVILYDAYPY